MLSSPLSQLANQLAHVSMPIAHKDLEISVIIPCFNAENTLPIALESLRCQTLAKDRFEVICVDDCSSDRSLDILEVFQSQFSHFKLLKHNSNRRQGAARNTGIEAARGRYITFVDADDFVRLDALEIMLSKVGGCDLLYAQHINTRFDRPFQKVTSNKTDDSSLMLAGLKGKVGWGVWAMLIKRSLLEMKNIRFREGVFFEDIDFSIQLCMNATSHVIIKEPVYIWVNRDNSTVNSINESKIADSTAAIKKVADLIDCRSTEEKEAFYARAKNWISLQARRIKEHNIERETSMRLIKIFCGELIKANLGSILGSDFIETLSRENNISDTTKSEFGQLKQSDKFSYSPWKKDFKKDFSNKVIFYCEVDYHIRNVAPIARALHNLGIECIIVDASHSTSFSTNRPLQDGERKLYADLDLRAFNVAKTLPFATDAAAFVFSNDLTYTKELIFENFGFGVPTFGFYEGINDDWNLDRNAPRFPYRSVDYLLLPGIYQAGFYRDRNCRVVGLHNVRSLFGTPYKPCTVKRAIINVNFTYGVLEDRRHIFLESAVQACEHAGIPYLITQHPADKSDLSEYPVSQDSVYNLLEEGSILISRFSTTILEALAMGRSAIYHNPINELVPKFHQSLGAFCTTRNKEELVAAIKKELDFTEMGGNIRQRAALFLHFHCNTSHPEEPANLAAQAIADVIRNRVDRFDFKTGRLPQIKYHMDGIKQNTLTRMASDKNAINFFPTTSMTTREASKDILGPYNRDFAAHYDETSALASYFSLKATTGVMIDVGAHYGTSLTHFLNRGWRIWAFEPDTINRSKLLERLAAQKNRDLVTLDTRCVSHTSQKNLPFFQSSESTGISGLSAFRNTHAEAQRVDTVSLSDYFAGQEMPAVDFLKIDTEGHDLFVLQGFPWERNRPRVIECEFEDLKTKPLGYTTKDMADFLVGKGYTVYVSEWHPILKYGQRHDWHRLQKYPCELVCYEAWGNLLAFSEPPEEARLVAAIQSVLKSASIQSAAAKAALPSSRPVSPSTLTGFVANGPNRWTYRKPSQSGVAKKHNNFLVFPMESSEPTRGREFLGAIHLVCNVACTVEFTLARKDTNQPFEGRATKAKIAPGTPWIGLVSHRFKENHDHLKLQIALKDMEAESAELEIQARAVVETPRSLAEHLDSDADLFSQAEALFRQAKYAEAVSLHALLAIRNLGVPYYEKMAKLGIASLGSVSEDFENIILNTLKN